MPRWNHKDRPWTTFQIVTIYTYDKSKVLEVDLATYNEQYPDSPTGPKCFEFLGMSSKKRKSPKKS